MEQEGKGQKMSVKKWQQHAPLKKLISKGKFKKSQFISSAIGPSTDRVFQSYAAAYL